MIPSLTLFEKEHASRERYMYFVCGLAAAIVAYVGKDYFPQRPYTERTWFMLSSLGCLTLCILFGMLSLVYYIKGLEQNKENLLSGEEMKTFVNTRVQRKAKNVTYTEHTKTGETISDEQLETLIKDLKAKSEEQFKEMSRTFAKSSNCFAVCQIFLVLGFVLLIIAKFVN